MTDALDDIIKQPLGANDIVAKRLEAEQQRKIPVSNNEYVSKAELRAILEDINNSFTKIENWIKDANQVISTHGSLITEVKNKQMEMENKILSRVHIDLEKPKSPFVR
jgi:glutamyl-tRNA reductase